MRNNMRRQLAVLHSLWVSPTYGWRSSVRSTILASSVGPNTTPHMRALIHFFVFSVRKIFMWTPSPTEALIVNIVGGSLVWVGVGSRCLGAAGLSVTFSLNRQIMQCQMPYLQLPAHQPASRCHQCWSSAPECHLLLEHPPRPCILVDDLMRHLRHRPCCCSLPHW